MINKKWGNLKQYYKNEKKKLARLKSGSAGTPMSSKWTHFNRMSFLDDVIVAEDSRSNLDENISTGETAVELLVNVEVI